MSQRTRSGLAARVPGEKRRTSALATLVLCLSAPGVFAYDDVKPIRIDRSKIPNTCGATLANYPMLFSVTDPDLRHTTSLGKVADLGGDDIIFKGLDAATCGAAPPCTLDHEIEKYVNTTGELVAWVRIPAVQTSAAASDTVIYMYFGDSAVTSPTERPDFVWDANFKGVWHLKEATGAIAADSTPNANSAVPNSGNPTSSTGEIGGALTFASPSRLVIPAAASLDLTSATTPDWTMSAWVKPTSYAGTNWPTIYSYGSYRASMGLSQATAGTDGRVENWTNDIAGNTRDSASAVTLNAWNYVTITRTAATTSFYLNGSADGSGPTPALVTLANQVSGIGSDGNGAIDSFEQFLGLIDEVRVSNNARSACWVAASYNNEVWPNKAVTPTPNPSPNPTSGFYTVGAAVSTAVELVTFTAVGLDGAVELEWATGSEIDNLGFQLYRSLSEAGPFDRLTSFLIPGRGFSATGASYAWRDSGLQNGTRYFYRLEDVDSKSVSTFHGPVSAVPQSGGTPPTPPFDGGSRGGGSGSGSDLGVASSACPPWALAQLGSSVSYTCEAHGNPAASFRVLSRTSRSALVELDTAGFLTARDATGRVRALLPDFDSLSDPRAPALPLKRARLEGIVGREARIESIQALENRVFTGLVAAAVGYPQAVVTADGTVRPGRRRAELGFSRGVFPQVQARLAGEGFQGEDKTVALELMPLRYDASRDALVLSRRLTVRLDFTRVRPSEVGRGRFGRHVPRPRTDPSAYAFLATSQKGLHAVAFETVFPGRSRPLDPAALKLTRRALPAGIADSSSPGLDAAPRSDSVPFFVLPKSSSFGPGSRLYFYVDATASSTSFSPEVVYALESGTGGIQMAPGDAFPDGSAGVPSRGFASFETNRIYAPDVLDIEDLWQWESLGSGVSKTKPFTLEGLDSSSPESARLVVLLQGGSDADSVVDHHVQVFVNGALVAEESFDGAVPHRVTADLPVSLLAVANDLTVLNVGDTGVASRVFLDRFEVLYPQLPAARSGAFDGVFSTAGTASVTGISPAALLDLTTSASWITGYQAAPSLRFRAQAGHRYLAVSPDALLAPRVFFPEPSARLRSTQNQADYVLVAPSAFLDAARPLLEHRQAQGLSTFAASLEEITSSFGGGQPTAEAIRDFLSFAYHQWRRPSPRYVLLLGDSNYDPRRFNPASQVSPMPFLLQKTSYIWTASDPALADLNGDDALPDLAIGRLPATTVEQAQTMVTKILDWEAQGQNLDGPAALVADNPDIAGDFEAEARDIETSFLSGRPTTEIFLGQIGDRDVARTQILDAFNSGLSLISYVGHGGGAVWAGENILNSADPTSLLAQPRQPFMLTMNCLNGYFIAPFYESLAEGFLKAQGKGTIAAFSPSGLSLDGPAHLYHRALMQEITAGQHQRLGDAVLAAQKAYAESGAFPELLGIYHLFGDPAMRVR